MKIKFENAKIVTMNESLDIVDGVLVTEGDTIAFVGKEYSGSVDRVIDCRGGLLCPGLINTHCHLAMSLYRGLGEGSDFSTWWQDNMRILEANTTKEQFALGVKLSVMELVRSGVTCVVDCYMYPEMTREILEKTGLRGYVAVGAITPEDHVSVQGLNKQFDEFKSDRVRPIGYAHSIYSIDEQNFAPLIKFCKDKNLPFTTHVSETLFEVGECTARFDKTPVGLLEDYGVLDLKTILAHCTHIDKDDMNILKNYDASVSTNPSSNLILGSGIAPIGSMLRNDINVTLGTDGASSNNTLSILKEMMLVGNLQSALYHDPKVVTALSSMKMATVNSAKALGNTEIGVLQKGKKADIILIDILRPNMQPLNSVYNHIVNSASANDVRITMVDGNILYEDGKYSFVEDELSVYKNVGQEIEKILKKAKK